ncbi:transcription initiation factor TFIID subunit 1-like [Antechinus flavipes]|uniref:transcription initiation factor TFIID subunit 1-like n=1 Tax=Antechinus flavipes TaxID=38775 RepID=UPI002236BDA9|nr:transcription initiation factor TFIID subunit 1-like [Antechinus flavipes]
MREAEPPLRPARLAPQVQAAPWNTTRAFLAATKGQCLLEVTGAADPTGCGEGISYVRLKQENKIRLEGERLMGTDADLRRLTLKKAQKLLRVFGVSEEEIKKLSRWEVIAAVRALSTKELKSGANSRDLTKFARTSQSSAAEQQRRFQQEVQRVFDLQNRPPAFREVCDGRANAPSSLLGETFRAFGGKYRRKGQVLSGMLGLLPRVPPASLLCPLRVLASTDVLSTDTDSETSDEENAQVLDSMCHDIEDLLEGKTNPQKLQRQKEKQEYQELQRLMLGGDGGARPQEKDRGPPASRAEFLVIYRTYVDESGKEYVRNEIVRDPAVIKVYIQVKTTQNEDSIRQFFHADEQKRQELRKEKKRLQDRLRRMRIANQREKQKEQRSPGKLPKPEAPKSKLLCGACGSHGHIKTNKACPKYCPPKDLGPRLKVMTQEQEERELAKRLPQESLIKVQETKIFMKRKLFETMNEVRRETLKVRVEKRPQKNPKNLIPHPKRKSVCIDDKESLSCIRHPCQPALPCPPTRRASSCAKSPGFPLKRSEQLPSVKSAASPPQKTPPSPANETQSEPEAPSFPRHKSWGLQNWLPQKGRSLTCPQKEKPDSVARTPPPKADRIPPARESRDPPGCSEPSGHRHKRPRNSLYQSGQEGTQEFSNCVSQAGPDRSRQSSPLFKDSQKPDPGASSWDRSPDGPSQKHHVSILYEDLQVSDTDDEESEESEESEEEEEI